MSRSLPIETVSAELTVFVDSLAPGEQLVLTSNGKPVAVLTRPLPTSWPCEPGSAKDRTLWMAPDFDAPLEDFASYME